jgi:hypothetical protein
LDCRCSGQLRTDSWGITCTELTHGVPKQKLGSIESYIAFLKQKALATDMTLPLAEALKAEI